MIRKFGKRLRLLLIVVAIVLIGATIAIWQPWRRQAVGLPMAIVNQAPFPVYYFDGDIPGGYKLEQSSLTYSNDALLFRLVNDKRAISVTQQPLPKALSASQYPNAKAVSGADGEAIISFNGTKPLGALFSNPADGARTLVLLSATDGVTASDMHSALQQLRVIPKWR